jgi:hypothetical protein
MSATRCFHNWRPERDGLLVCTQCLAERERLCTCCRAPVPLSRLYLRRYTRSIACGKRRMKTIHDLRASYQSDRQPPRRASRADLHLASALERVEEFRREYDFDDEIESSRLHITTTTTERGDL